jgi:hypothetical protein
MTYMENKKIICIILALIFGLSLFASGAFARGVCEKGHCKHHSMEGALLNAIANSTLKGAGCCAESQRDPCDLESGQALELHDCALSMTWVPRDGPSEAIVIGSDFMSDNFTFRVFGPHLKAGTKVLSSSIYIRNVSLLC